MSTLKVNKIEATGTTDGGIEIDSDGHVQLDGVQLPTSGPLSNRNLIINGAMRVAQRATSTTTGTGGYNTVDRWRSSQNSGGLGTNFHQSQATDVPANQGFSNSLKHVNKSSQTVTASMGSWLEHKFEGQDLQQLKYGSANAVSLTVSFWVKSTATGTFCVQLYNFDSSRAQVKEYTINAADTWEFKTLTFSGDTNTSITPIDDDNNDSGALKFIMGSGTDQHISADTWHDVTLGDRAYCTSNQNNEMITTADEEFYITGVQLEVGDKATPFEHRSYGDELARCQRYYQEYTGIEFRHYVHNVLRSHVPLLVTMRDNPIVTKSYTDTSGLNADNTSAYASMLRYDIQYTGAGNGVIDLAGGTITLSAEL